LDIKRHKMIKELPLYHNDAITSCIAIKKEGDSKPTWQVWTGSNDRSICIWLPIDWDSSPNPSPPLSPRGVCSTGVLKTHIFLSQDCMLVVDLVNCVADFDRRVHQVYGQQFPNAAQIPFESRTKRVIEDNFPKAARQAVRDIYAGKGFWSEVPPVDGAISALKEMLSEGIQVFVWLGAPSAKNFAELQEKLEWITKHFGEEWAERVIISDKRTVSANVLIDTGRRQKKTKKLDFRHVMFAQPYNATRDGKSQRMSVWTEWRQGVRSAQRSKGK